MCLVCGTSWWVDNNIKEKKVVKTMTCIKGQNGNCHGFNEGENGEYPKKKKGGHQLWTEHGSVPIRPCKPPYIRVYLSPLSLSKRPLLAIVNSIFVTVFCTNKPHAPSGKEAKLPKVTHLKSWPETPCMELANDSWNVCLRRHFGHFLCRLTTFSDEETCFGMDSWFPTRPDRFWRLTHHR